MSGGKETRALRLAATALWEALQPEQDDGFQHNTLRKHLLFFPPLQQTVRPRRIEKQGFFCMYIHGICSFLTTTKTQC